MHHTFHGTWLCDRVMAEEKSKGMITSCDVVNLLLVVAPRWLARSQIALLYISLTSPMPTQLPQAIIDICIDILKPTTF